MVSAEQEIAALETATTTTITALSGGVGACESCAVQEVPNAPGLLLTAGLCVVFHSQT